MADGDAMLDIYEVYKQWNQYQIGDSEADNLWPLLKVCCDALARGPRRDLPGLRLVPDDTPEYMTKHAPIISPPPNDGLWLDIEVTE